MFALALAAATAAIPQFTVKPCLGDMAQDASIVCGEVVVAEDRTRPNGRKIALNVVVLKALSPASDLPPLIDIDGGPGLASTRSAAFYASDGKPYRARRDVVLVDQRGTGRSNPLDCPNLAKSSDTFAPLYPIEGVRTCRAALEKRADLTQYGTIAAAQDLDEVRQALGHEQIDIVAISYGTTLALQYLDAFPDRVRAAVLSGTVPASYRPPRFHAQNAEQALNLTFADCAADTECRRAFPDLAGDLNRALKDMQPLDRELFLEQVRTLLYAPITARQVPFLIHAAAYGDLRPLTKLAGTGAPSSYSDGLYLSITCSESIATMPLGQARRAARATRFGDYRLRVQGAACTAWPKAAVPAKLYRPVRSNAAVLFLTGGRDPVTPQAWTNAAARFLPNSRVAVIPWSGHIFDGLSGVDTCYDPLLLRFFDSGDAARLDISCLAAMLPPPFKTSAA